MNKKDIIELIFYIVLIYFEIYLLPYASSFGSYLGTCVRGWFVWGFIVGVFKGRVYAPGKPRQNDVRLYLDKVHVVGIKQSAKIHLHLIILIGDLWQIIC